MDREKVEKNIHDLKYQTSISFSMKSLGLAFTLLAASATVGASINSLGKGILTGMLLWELFFIIFFVFYRRSKTHLTQIRSFGD